MHRSEYAMLLRAREVDRGQILAHAKAHPCAGRQSGDPWQRHHPALGPQLATRHETRCYYQTRRLLGARVFFRGGPGEESTRCRNRISLLPFRRPYTIGQLRSTTSPVYIVKLVQLALLGMHSAASAGASPLARKFVPLQQKSARTCRSFLRKTTRPVLRSCSS